MAEFPKILLDGYHQFLNHYQAEPLFYRRLAEEGQKPEIMVIGCCDSRAAPEIIFQTGPGEIFVTRNIANQVPPFQPDSHFHATSAALEYAVKGLRVKHIMVLGHGRCGGIAAALEQSGAPEAAAANQSAGAESAAKSIKSGLAKDGAAGQNAAANSAAHQRHSAAAAAQSGQNCACGKSFLRGAPQDSPYDFIGDWMQLLRPAAEEVAANALMTQAERQKALEQLSLRFSLRNLRSFPWIKQAEEQGALALHAAWFDIGSAELWRLDEETDRFTLLPQIAAPAN